MTTAAIVTPEAEHAAASAPARPAVRPLTRYTGQVCRTTGRPMSVMPSLALPPIREAVPSLAASPIRFSHIRNLAVKT
jgi:hypothetical protein